MPSVKRAEVFEVDINKFFDVIVDYDSYPEFVDGVSEIEVIEQEEDHAQVEYSLNLIKKFKYILNLKHVRPTSVSWELVSGDIFKRNQGSWTLVDLGDGKTEVTYKLDLDIKGFAPKAIVKKLAGHNLPAMMEAYFKRASK